MARDVTRQFPFRLFFWASFLLCLHCSDGVPTLEETPLEPVLAVSGEEVLIDCVVKNLQNYTVIWRRVVPGTNKTEILTAGQVSIIPDSRFSLLHQKGHDTWVLQIHPAQVNDSGRYICEVNTNPRMQIFRMLTVVERITTGKSFPVDHNYTGCCVNHGVPSNCRDFCSLQSVIMGGHPNPWQCMEHLPTITRCLTDGRNHMPCCIRQKIPEVCRSVCTGDYGLTTVLQHYSCMDYTIPTLSCIAEGIELLPGPPKEVSVEAISSSEVRVKWFSPQQSVPVTSYQINVTLIQDLTNLEAMENGMVNQKSSRSFPNKKSGASVNSFFTVTVDANKTSYTMRNLEPMTMYEVQMSSHNSYGSSMPTVALRVLTLASDGSFLPTNKEANSTSLHLPNITRCCEQKGVPEGRCLQSLCDPSHNEESRLSDMLVCAPWLNVSFECMSLGKDHTRCCQQRGLPDVCLDFCRGNVTHLDYRHFVCLEHIHVYGSCLLEFYGVLPGPPEAFLVTVVQSHWAVLRWKTPKILPESVRSYVFYWRELISDEITEYNVVADVNSPFLLDNLHPLTRYEVYVAAKNEYGTSRGSVRAVFTTAALVTEYEESAIAPFYNETSCCVAAGLRKGCLDLCTYNMKMADLQLLAVPCADQLEILVRCGAGGRDHAPCCQRRGVRWDCLPLCSAIVDMTPQEVVRTCVGAAGKIIQCMSEGVSLLPPTPEGLHTILILPTRIHLKWHLVNTSSTPTWFEVRYTETEDQIPPHPLDYTDRVNASASECVLQNLKSNAFFSFYVVAVNEYGTSLPSLVLVVHTPEREEIYNETLNASLGPPHSLEVTHQTMDSVTVSWQPPFHVPVDAALSFIVLYQAANSSQDMNRSLATAATTLNSIVLNNLAVNTQYAIAVKARTGKQESHQSETVLAWTDPAIPAFLNPPVVVPPEPIVEGANVTLLCVATGMPVPVVSLFLNGQLMIQQQQSHVALVVPNIQHNVTKVDCFADNGLGQGAQSSMNLEVSFEPSVDSVEKTVRAEVGSIAVLRCVVSGHPEPRVLWYRDTKLREPLKRGQDIELLMKPYKEKSYMYMASLTIHNISEANDGQYFCHAENQYGKDTLLVHLEVMHDLFANASACCEQEGVSDECQEACSVGIDIQAALNKPKCFKDLDKLMYCAADGSDHKKCCRDRGIGRSCLRWCQGRPIINTHLCILHAAKIASCFEEGKGVLPGPPRNIKIHQILANALEISWESPQKNPKAVQWYKIFWRPVGSRTMYRNHTKEQSLMLYDLEPGTTYEVVVKAGNHYGISLHSEPVSFSLSGNDVTAMLPVGSANYDNGSAGKTAVGVVVTALLLVLGGALVIFMYLRFRGKPSQGTSVSFENPTYMKDANVPQVNATNSVAQNSSPEENHCDHKKDTNQT